MTREPVELAALHAVADLTVDPRLPADPEGLALGHRSPSSQAHGAAHPIGGVRWRPCDARRGPTRGSSSPTGNRARSRAGWVRLRVEACGICGARPALPPRAAASPLGHLARVTSWLAPWSTARAGSADVRYAVSPNVTCGECGLLSQRPDEPLRPRRSRGWVWGRDGGLGELVDAPLENLAAVPDGVDAVTASLTEPVAVAVHGRRPRGASEPDDTVLVLGAAHRRAVRRAGRARRAADGRHLRPPPAPRAAAEAIGVTVLDESEGIAWGKEHRPEVVIESVGGTADTLTDAVRVVGRGGRIVVLGTFSGPTRGRRPAPDDEGGRAARLLLLRER